jgi:predicted RNA methylase
VLISTGQGVASLDPPLGVDPAGAPPNAVIVVLVIAAMEGPLPGAIVVVVIGAMEGPVGIVMVFIGAIVVVAVGAAVELADDVIEITEKNMVRAKVNRRAA